MKNQNKNARTCGRCCTLTLSDSVYRPSGFLAHHYHSHHSPPFSLSPILLHSSIPTRPAPSRAHHQSPKQICKHFHTNLNPPFLPAFTSIFLNLPYHHTSSKPHLKILSFKTHTHIQPTHIIKEKARPKYSLVTYVNKLELHYNIIKSCKLYTGVRLGRNSWGTLFDTKLQNEDVTIQQVTSQYRCFSSQRVKPVPTQTYLC